MKYWDTSALLRAWKEGWTPTGQTRTHTIAEWFQIQVGRGLVFTLPDGRQEKRALTWQAAAREARRLFAGLSLVDLPAETVLDALDRLAAIPGLRAAAVHDYLHIRAAETHGASSIVTLNLEEWSRLTKLRLEPPLKHPAGQAGAGEPVPGNEAAQR